jgi:hypothetical protein
MKTIYDHQLYADLEKKPEGMKKLNQDAVFMICFAQGQDHLIARREIDFTYCPMCKSYLKTSECTPNQLRRLMRHGKNQDFSFSYNGELIENWIVDFNEMAPSVAKIIVDDKFPGYEDEDMPEGHSPERGVDE